MRCGMSSSLLPQDLEVQQDEGTSKPCSYLSVSLLPPEMFIFVTLCLAALAVWNDIVNARKMETLPYC